MKLFIIIVTFLTLFLFSFFSCTPPVEDEAMKYIEVAGADGPGFAVDFADRGGSSQHVAFGIDNDGNIHIMGVADYTPANSVISPPAVVFTLPAGYRPSHDQYFGVTLNGYANQFGLISVLTDGRVFIGTSPTALDWFPFGHIIVAQ